MFERNLDPMAACLLVTWTLAISGGSKPFLSEVIHGNLSDMRNGTTYLTISSVYGDWTDRIKPSSINVSSASYLSHNSVVKLQKQVTTIKNEHANVNNDLIMSPKPELNVTLLRDDDLRDLGHVTIINNGGLVIPGVLVDKKDTFKYSVLVRNYRNNSKNSRRNGLGNGTTGRASRRIDPCMVYRHLGRRGAIKSAFHDEPRQSTSLTGGETLTSNSTLFFTRKLLIALRAVRDLQATSYPENESKTTSSFLQSNLCKSISHKTNTSDTKRLLNQSLDDVPPKRKSFQNALDWTTHDGNKPLEDPNDSEGIPEPGPNWMEAKVKIPFTS